jgi:hypothetical protein
MIMFMCMCLCMSMCLCLFVYVYVCVCVCVCVCVYVCVYVRHLCHPRGFDELPLQVVLTVHLPLPRVGHPCTLLRLAKQLAFLGVQHLIWYKRNV